jgi:hypothetical protein
MMEGQTSDMVDDPEIFGGKINSPTDNKNCGSAHWQKPNRKTVIVEEDNIERL